MALMERVTRRGSFLDLGQMDQTEFRAWWRAMRREADHGVWMLLDVYECESPKEWTAIAYAEDWRGAIDADAWWHRETDNECELYYYRWDAEDLRWEYIPSWKFPPMVS